MNYYLDTEFLEGKQPKSIGKTPPTIDLISIAIVGENGKEYYAISKDFNLKAAWNRKQITTGSIELPYFWHRENVLKPIFWHLNSKLETGKMLESMGDHYFTLANFKFLINKFGKSNSQIADEIKDFLYPSVSDCCFASGMGSIDEGLGYLLAKDPIRFWGYYSAYDWVALCWLYGIMMELPYGYPMYCKDLKQIFDEKQSIANDNLKSLESYPQNADNHNALSDARWNKALHDFLLSIG